MKRPKLYKKNNTIVLIDNGHGADNYTNGKCSPLLDESFDLDDPTVYNGRFREGNFNRIIAKSLAEELNSYGIEAKLIVPEDEDISLRERARRVNSYWQKHTEKDIIFISIHANAAGDGTKWNNATGFSAHVASNAGIWSKRWASRTWAAAMTNGYKGNRAVPREQFIVNDFYIIRHTAPPCILVENLFYDNKDDLRKLMDPTHRKNITRYLAAGILNLLD